MNIISGGWLDNHFDISTIRYIFTGDKLICRYTDYFDSPNDLPISKYLLKNYKTPVKSFIVALLLQDVMKNYKINTLIHKHGCIYDAMFFKGCDLYNEICKQFDEIKGLKYEYTMKGENGKIISRFKFDLDTSIFTREKKKDFLTLCKLRNIFE